MHLPIHTKLFSHFRNKETLAMWKRIGGITWPAFVELVLSTLFAMVDMVMLGRVEGKGAIFVSSVGLTNQPQMLLLVVFAAVNIGATTVVAWNIGSKNSKRASAVAAQVMSINFIMGSIISIIGILAARPVVAFMGAGPDTLTYATHYFQIISAGVMFQTVTLAVTASLRGAGETRIPMLYNIFSNMLNVAGNYLLIYGKFGFPEMGVEGAALSTTISKGIGFLLVVYVVLFYKKTQINIKIRDWFKWDLSIIKQILRIGLPSCAEQLIMQSGFVMYARTVSALGTEVFAAHQIALNISGLVFSPSMAFSVAATALVGLSLGAGEPEKAENYAKAVRVLANVVGCFTGTLFLIFAYPFALVYTTNTEVARLAAIALRIMAIAQLGQSTQMATAGALRGAGDTMYPLYASLFGIWIFRVFVAMLFVNVFGWGLAGAWVTLVLDQYARALVVVLRFRSNKWKTIRATKGDKHVGVSSKVC